MGPSACSCMGRRTRNTVLRGSAVAVDDAAMVADDLGDQRQAEAGTVVLVVTNGSNRCDFMISAMPGPLSSTSIIERQRHARLGARHRQPDAGPEGGRENNAAFSASRHRFGGVLHEIEEDLDELVAIAVNGRQRGIVLLGEADAARKADSAIRFTRSSTEWILTGSAPAAARRRTLPCGRRDCGYGRSPSQIRRASARSSSDATARGAGRRRGCRRAGS